METKLLDLLCENTDIIDETKEHNCDRVTGEEFGTTIRLFPDVLSKTDDKYGMLPIFWQSDSSKKANLI